jgi:hypothetical protein
MPRQVMTDDEFLLKIMPCLGQKKPSYRQIAKLSGLSLGGARYKIEKLIREGRLSISEPVLTAGEVETTR